MRVSGLLLAGGSGRRMGRDKALVPVDGEPLARRVLRVLDDVCDDVWVASGDGRRLAWLGRPQVADTHPGAGPLAGLAAGLAAARHERVAVLAVDLPFASAALLRLLAARWEGQAALVPESDGRAQPLHAVWARAVAPALVARLDAGRHGVTAAADALGAVRVPAEDWAGPAIDPRFAHNLNTPEQAAALDHQPGDATARRSP